MQQESLRLIHMSGAGRIRAGKQQELGGAARMNRLEYKNKMQHFILQPQQCGSIVGGARGVAMACKKMLAALLWLHFVAVCWRRAWKYAEKALYKK